MYEFKNGKIQEVQNTRTFTREDMKALGIKKYKGFVRNALGFAVFQGRSGMRLVTSSHNSEIAKLMAGTELVRTYYVTDEDFKNLTYSDSDGKVVDVFEWLSTNNGKWLFESAQLNMFN